MARKIVGFTLIGLVSMVLLLPPSARADPGGVPAAISALEVRVAELEALVAALQGQILPGLSGCVTVDTTNTLNGVVPPHVIVEGCNFHVRGGTSTNTINGWGNLIVGHNEQSVPPAARGGSNNLVVGSQHEYTSRAGFVAGFGNTVSGGAASVSGGQFNTASGAASSVSGGMFNTASGSNSSVSAGNNNEASNEFSSVSGGGLNLASGNRASVSGGGANTASGPFSSVGGGTQNTASGSRSSVSGGLSRSALGEFDWSAGSLSEDF